MPLAVTYAGQAPYSEVDGLVRQLGRPLEIAHLAVVGSDHEHIGRVKGREELLSSLEAFQSKPSLSRGSGRGQSARSGKPLFPLFTRRNPAQISAEFEGKKGYATGPDSVALLKLRDLRALHFTHRSLLD